MRMSSRLLATSLLTWMAGCGASVPTSPASPQQPVTYMFSGIASETVDGLTRPLADHNLGLAIHETEGLPIGLTLRGSGQQVTTDHNGRYTARVPRSRVYVSVWGKRQPCLASAYVDKDTTVDVQVFPAGTSITPFSVAGPIITAFVYETTPEGRRPLRGAEAWLDLGQDSYVANTETDEAGRFFFCRVDTRVRMDLFADGYQPYQYAEFISGTGDRSFEFEFRR
jgi:hypothetical protein